MSVSPARNASCSRTFTSRSRLVVTPWIGRGASAPASARAACVAGRRPRDDLGEHRVVVHARPVPSSTPESRRTPCGGRPDLELARRRRGSSRRCSGPLCGCQPRRRVLGVEPDLDRMPLCGRGIRRQPAAVGDVELQRDEVEAGRAFGDRVLDLQPGVHLEEEEPAVVVGEELDRPGAGVADRLRGSARGVEQRLAHAGDALDEWRRRLLDHLLVPALDRALAFADGPHRAVRVGHDLHLDVPAGGEVGLAEHGRVAERRLRLGLRELDLAGRSASSVTTRMPRPPPPALALISTGRSAAVTVVRVEFGRARARRPQPSAASPRSCCPSPSIASGGGPIQVSPASMHGPRERGVLGQEAVAGMDRVGAGAPRSVDDQVGAQVGVGRRGAGQPDGGVGLARRAARRHPGRRTPRRCRAPGRGRCGTPGARSRRGSRPALMSAHRRNTP